MRVLFTNNTLASRAGSELYVRDLALALLKRGHNPVAYSTHLGEVAEELRQATIPVVDDLEALSVAPDVIHGQHHLDAMTAMLRFPDTPAIQVCHGWLPWEETPHRFSSIQRYVAVDDLCRERLFSTVGVPMDLVEVIYNFVDLERFRRRLPLPDRPRSALVFSNYMAQGECFEAIRSACVRFGIHHLDILGASAGSASPAPEKVLGAYDIVFAKARCALEAMATGCAAVVMDYSKLGGMVTTQNVERMRALNFGVRTLQQGDTSEASILEALQRYDAGDAAKVCDWIRSRAGLEDAVERWLNLYEEVIQSGRKTGRDATSQLAQGRARLQDASDYLKSLAPRLKTLYEVHARMAATEGELTMVHHRKAELEAEMRSLESRYEIALAEQALPKQPKKQSPLRRLERFLRHLRKGHP